MRLARNEDVNRGMGSSGFVEWLRSGRKGLNGLGWSSKVGASEGTSMLWMSAYMDLQRPSETGRTIDQVAGQYQYILYDICPFCCRL